MDGKVTIENAIDDASGNLGTLERKVAALKNKISGAGPKDAGATAAPYPNCIEGKARHLMGPIGRIERDIDDIMTSVAGFAEQASVTDGPEPSRSYR